MFFHSTREYSLSAVTDTSNTNTNFKAAKMLLHDSCYKSHRMAPKNDTMHVRLFRVVQPGLREKHCTLSSDAPYPHWVFSLTRGLVGKQASHRNLSLRNKRLIQIAV